MRTNTDTASNGNHRLVKQADGYVSMGLLDEAEVCLRAACETEGPEAERARGNLAHLLLGQRRYEESAALGLDLIKRGAIDEDVIINAMLALHFMGRFEEARETLNLLGQLGVAPEREAYQQACFATRLGEFPEALRWLLMEFRRSSEYFVHACEDTDLTALWAWMRHHQPTLEEAHDILETPLGLVKDECHKALLEVRYSAGDLDELPESVRGLLRYDYAAGCCQMPPLWAARNQEALERLLDVRRAQLGDVENALSEAETNALHVVLAAQPRYAAEHASWRNHLGARYHILWALPRQPSLMEEFLATPGLEMMRPLLEEYAFATERDPGFGVRMDKVFSCLEDDPDRAWAVLNETPNEVRETGIYQLRLASVYEAEGDFARSLPIWEALRKRWPDDVVGYGNAVGALIKLGRPEEAKKLLEDSPLCFRRYRTYHRHRATLYDTPSPTTLPRRRFLGRPDLNGEILSASCTAVKSSYLN